MKKALAIAGILALSIIPTPSFSGEVEQKEMMSVTEQLLPQIADKYKNLDIKEKKAYKELLIEYLEDVEKTGESGGVGVAQWFRGKEYCREQETHGKFNPFDRTTYCWAADERREGFGKWMERRECWRVYNNPPFKNPCNLKRR